MLVREWMITDPITVAPECCLAIARKLMKERRICVLPVVRERKLLGIVTRYDLEAATAPWAHELGRGDYIDLLCRVEVQEMMVKNPITIAENDTIEDATELMLDRGVSNLPVVTNDNELVGIITETDILKGFVKATKRIRALSNPQIAMRY
jgi:acetoin utilization protein AcuB